MKFVCLYFDFFFFWTLENSIILDMEYLSAILQMILM